MGEAALYYARRGWPVFPCREVDETIERGDGKRTFKAKQPYTTHGLKDATTDEHQIKLWWTRWPNAMIGLPMGVNGCFALDFDPRTDGDGEVFTLERLKAELEAQIGCELPTSLAAITPSDGVHVYLAQPEGEPIRNRGNLPRHVDVRGLGGYVIAPPSIIHPGTPEERRYRFLRGKWDAEVEQAPAALVEVLRAPKGGRSAAPPPARTTPAGEIAKVTDAQRKWALTAFDNEIAELQATPMAGGRYGGRNEGIFHCANVLGQIVAAGALSEAAVRGAIEAVIRGFGRDYEQCARTMENGLQRGMGNPRDLSDVGRQAGSSRGPPHTPRSGGENRRPSQPGAGGSNALNEGGGGEAAADIDLTRCCAFKPLTDLGNLERFMERFGRDFLYVEAWGWQAWDGKRWNREMAVPMLGHAVQRTMRAIQDEADFIRDSGVPEEPLEIWTSEQKAEHAERQRGHLDRVLEVKRGKRVLLSDSIAKWGRTSEAAAHINCIGRLAEARLSARTGDFDVDPLKLNVENGTIVFSRPDRGLKPAWTRREHRREDRLTKLAPVVHDKAAKCPQFDAFLNRVQPDIEMQVFLDCWGGYSSLGLADAQKMAVFYGEGNNGKGVWITTVASILGDYAWKTGVETFIDQGRYRKGSDATPDLAALVGRRMVYANEPEENSKFSDGLVKAMTSDEPLGGVRELNRSPFELPVTFNNTVLANNMPRIGTDHGIQRRMQVVPWDVVIPDEEVDPQLKSRLMAEASGILNRLISGALAYLENGLPLPEAVKEATREYQEENDLLGEFIRLAVARVPGEKVGATAFHRAFAAWQTWANKLPQSGKPWSPKYLYSQMKKKRFRDGKSSTKQWHDIALRFEELDFVTVDEAGRMKARDVDLPEPKRFDGEVRPEVMAPPSTPPEPDERPPPDPDDFIPGFDE